MATFTPVNITGITFAYDMENQRYEPYEAEGQWSYNITLPGTSPYWSRGLTGSGQFVSTSNYSLYVRQTFSYSSSTESYRIPIRMGSSSSSSVWGYAYFDVSSSSAAIPYNVTLTRFEFNPDYFPTGTSDVAAVLGFYKTNTSYPATGSSINISSSDFIYFIVHFQVTKPTTYTYNSTINYYSDNTIRASTTIQLKTLDSTLTTLPIPISIPNYIEMIADSSTGQPISKEGYYSKGWCTTSALTSVDYGGISTGESEIPANTIPCTRSGNPGVFNLYSVWQAAPEIYIVRGISSNLEADLRRVLQAKVVTSISGGAPVFKDIDYGEIQISSGVWKQF